MTAAHLVIDFETLAIGPRARVLEFGAVALAPETFEPFVRLSIEVNPFDGDQADRVLCPDTWRWWGERMAAGHEMPGLDSDRSLGDMVAEFMALWGSECARSTQLWCWGLDFDVPILADILHTYGHQPPWSHKRAGCIRTLCRELRISWLPGRECEHRALADAVEESGMLTRALRMIAKTSGERGQG